MVSKKKVRQSLFSQGISYLKESRNYVYLVVGLFFISCIVGFYFSGSFSFFNELLDGLRGQIEGLGWFGLIWFIFKNNFTSAFYAMALGIIFGIIPLFNALTNGSLLGYVYALASEQGGYGVIWYIIPHGIFELPAIFIALGMGMRMGMFIFASKGNKLNELRRRFFGSVLAFTFVVLPLLIIAAFIEGTLIYFSG